MRRSAWAAALWSCVASTAPAPRAVVTKMRRLSMDRSSQKNWFGSQIRRRLLNDIVRAFLAVGRNRVNADGLELRKSRVSRQSRIERKRNPGMLLIRQAVPGFRLRLHSGYQARGQRAGQALRPQRAAYALRCEREFAQAHARQRRDGVANRAGDQRHAVFAGAGRRIVG